MKARLWGARGSVAAAGPDTVRYGGNTSCVEVVGADGTRLILDAGTGIRRLGTLLEPDTDRIDLLLTHLHMDHIQGLGFFAPLFQPDRHIHIWGPPSTTLSLRDRLARYLSPPLFPVLVRELPCRLWLHHVPPEPFEIGGLAIEASLVCHPGATLGYRITEHGRSVTYMPDHEPALGVRDFPADPEWTSGFDLAAGADLLIHDAQYTADEYAQRVGWGHSTIEHALRFADAAGVGRIVTFHHDPSHSDVELDRLLADAVCGHPHLRICPGTEGTSFDTDARSP
jgi:phosphoribosyl 1,2-cyclic phosphodiesterase